MVRGLGSISSGSTRYTRPRRRRSTVRLRCLHLGRLLHARHAHVVAQLHVTRPTANGGRHRRHGRRNGGRREHVSTSPTHSGLPVPLRVLRWMRRVATVLRWHHHPMRALDLPLTVPSHAHTVRHRASSQMHRRSLDRRGSLHPPTATTQRRALMAVVLLMVLVVLVHVRHRRGRSHPTALQSTSLHPSRVSKPACLSTHWTRVHVV